MYNSTVYHLFARLCSHHHSLNQSTSPPPRESHHPLNRLFPVHLPQLWATVCVLFGPNDLPVLHIHSTWICTTVATYAGFLHLVLCL